MKNNVFELVKKDLETAIKDDDKFFITNLNNIVNRISNVQDAIDKELTNNDVLIILKDIHHDITKKISDGTYSNSTYSDKIKKLLSMMKNYFSSVDVSIDGFNSTTLSNNSELTEVDNQIDKGKESLEINNTLSTILFIAGIIFIIVSFILGIILGTINNEFNLSIAIIYWLTGGISGLLIIGFSEIIKILHDIRRKLYAPQTNKKK